MKKYLVFCGDYFYPNGGMKDFRNSFSTIKEARAYLLEADYDWFQIVDKKSCIILEENT